VDHKCRKEEVIDIVLAKVTAVETDVKKLLTEVAILSVKSSVWGVAGGAIVLALWILKTGRIQ